MAEFQNFNLDTSDYLGIKYDEYINFMQSKSISQPTEYTRIRNSVIKQLKQDLLEQTFKSYYNLLTTGNGFNDLPMAPSYPKQEASNFALGVTKTINKILDEVLAIVLPAQQADFARLQQGKKAQASNIDVPTPV